MRDVVIVSTPIPNRPTGLPPYTALPEVKIGETNTYYEAIELCRSYGLEIPNPPAESPDVERFVVPVEI